MKDDERLGEVLRDGDEVTLKYVREFRHPLEAVWAALTESESLRAWMPVDLIGERSVGARLEARFWPEVVEKYGMEDAGMPTEILIWDPPRTFEWRWDTDILRFELSPCPAGTRLVFTTKIDTREVPGHKTGAGYHLCLDCLQGYLDDGAPEVPLIDQPTEELEARYLRTFER